MKPNEILADWLDSLHEDIKYELSGHIAALIPDLWVYLNKVENSELDSKEKWSFYHKIFLKWLLDDGEVNGIAAAKALMARTLIEFFGFEGRKTSEDWDDGEKRQQKILAMFEEEGRHDMVESGKSMFENTASLSMVWLIAYSEWQNLCDNELSDFQIRQWLNENPDIPK